MPGSASQLQPPTVTRSQPLPEPTLRTPHVIASGTYPMVPQPKRSFSQASRPAHSVQSDGKVHALSIVQIPHPGPVWAVAKKTFCSVVTALQVSPDGRFKATSD